jgi:hypothetical protein
MMGEPIIASLYPFEQPPTWLEWMDEGGNSWRFRACWIVRDLHQVYAVLNDATHSTNQRWDVQTERMIHRIQRRLKTLGEQSMVLEKQGKVVSYWELAPVSRTNLLIHCPLQVEGWVLYYLVPKQVSHSDSWIGAIRQVLEYVRTSTRCAFRLLIEVPHSNKYMQRILESVGFETIATYTNPIGLVVLYRWSS